MRPHIVLLLLSFLISCSEEEPVRKEWKDPLEGLPDNGQVRFDEPAIGQRSYYISFRAYDDYVTEVVRYEYKTDTLVLAITAKEAAHWIVKEYITEGSTLRQTADEDSTLDSVFVTALRVESDSIYFGDPSGKSYYSRFFGIRANTLFTLPLTLVTEPAGQNPDCSPFSSRDADAMEYALNYVQLGQTFSHLNVYADNSMTATDGPALMYTYGPSNGFVRMTAINPWIGNEAVGWDLAPR